jgi:hypothetical protein
MEITGKRVIVISNRQPTFIVILQKSSQINVVHQPEMFVGMTAADVIPDIVQIVGCFNFEWVGSRSCSSSRKLGMEITNRA